MGMASKIMQRQGNCREQMSKHQGNTTCEHRFGAEGSGAASFSGALNDPSISLALNILPCNLH